MHAIQRWRRPVAVLAAGLAAASVGTLVMPAADAAAPAKPTVSSVFNNHFHIASGSTGGEARITIEGSHFVNVKRVTFGGAGGTQLHVVSQHTLTVVLPDHPAGRVDVRVVTTAGTSSINPSDQFDFQVRNRLDGGGSHSCQALSTGIARCWGFGGQGQLGNGNDQERLTPVQVTGLSDAVSVATGDLHSCALLADGTVECWGYNADGQLGNDTTTDSSIPVKVVGLGTALAISAGGNDSCALVVGGTVKCWGSNDNGRLGNRSTTQSSVPVQVDNLNNAVDVGSGDAHNCATRSDGGESCWGDNYYGELGDGTTINRHVAVSVLGVHHAIATALGFDVSCILNSGGKVACWGYGPDGQRGDGTTTTVTTHAEPVSDLSNVTKLAYGLGQGCAVVSSGAARCWGFNHYGEVGNGRTRNALVPATVVGLRKVVDIGCGDFHSLALLKDGTTTAWGDNFDGQLGDGTTTERHTPVTVS